MAKRKKPDSKKDVQKEIEEKLGPKGRKLLEEGSDLIGNLIDEMLPEDATFEDYEKAALEIANELARRRLERKLQSIGDGHAPALRIDHNDDWFGIGWGHYSRHEFRQHLPGTVTYHSLVGPLRVRRYTYRECVRNGPTYVPLDLDAGLMERMTPGFARCLAFSFSQVPIREVDRLLHAAGRCPPSRATLDRCAKDVGRYAMGCNDEIEPRVRAEEVLPAGTVAIALGLDRTAVAMRPDDHHWIGIDRDIHRPRPKGAPRSAGKGVSWRLDYVATVTFLDAKGERLDSRHYRLRAEADPESMVDRMVADVRHALEQSPKLRILVVQDGAPELWNVIRKKLKAEPLVKRWDEVLDWYHLDERLSACLDLSSVEPQQRQQQRSGWHRMLLKKKRGTSIFLRSLRGFERKIPDASKDKFQEHVNFFMKRTELLGYRRIRRKKLPIGSGATEGACKSLIGTRAKRNGQHWTQRGLSAALHFRAIDQCGRFDAFWSLFSQRYRAVSMTPIAIRA